MHALARGHSEYRRAGAALSMRRFSFVPARAHALLHPVRRPVSRRQLAPDPLSESRADFVRPAGGREQQIPESPESPRTCPTTHLADRTIPARSPSHPANPGHDRDKRTTLRSGGPPATRLCPASEADVSRSKGLRPGPTKPSSVGQSPRRVPSTLDTPAEYLPPRAATRGRGHAAPPTG